MLVDQRRRGIAAVIVEGDVDLSSLLQVEVLRFLRQVIRSKNILSIPPPRDFAQSAWSAAPVRTLVTAYMCRPPRLFEHQDVCKTLELAPVTTILLIYSLLL